MPSKIDIFLKETEEELERNRDSRKILVLGSNYPPEEADRRNNVIGRLKKMGYRNTVKMEDIGRDCERLDDHFCNLFRDYHLILALLAREAAREGVCWEIGFMQGISQEKINDLYDRLFLCLQEKVIDGEGREAITKMVSKGIVKDNDIKAIKFEGDDILEAIPGQVEAHFAGLSV